MSFCDKIRHFITQYDQNTTFYYTLPQSTTFYGKIRHFTTCLDILRQITTNYDILQQNTTFNEIFTFLSKKRLLRHYSIFDISHLRQISTKYDILQQIQHFMTKSDILRQDTKLPCANDKIKVTISEVINSNRKMGRMTHLFSVIFLKQNDI